MNQEQAIAFVQSQILCAQAEIEAMKIENHERIDAGTAPAYGYKHFMAIPDKYGLGHNAVLETLRGA